MIRVGTLNVDAGLYQFVKDEVISSTLQGICPNSFFTAMGKTVHDLSPRLKYLLSKRASLQQQLDSWHRQRRSQGTTFTKSSEIEDYKQLLQSIGYLLPQCPHFTVIVENVDPEIAEVAAPQLVVPLSNPRYAINAANARWGSLYDALYGTDVISESEGKAKIAADGSSYNPSRGAAVIEWAANFLNSAIPLEQSSVSNKGYRALEDYAVWDNTSSGMKEVRFRLQDGQLLALKDPCQFVGFNGGTGNQGSNDEAGKRSLLFVNNGLHIELVFDKNHPVGRSVKSGLCDVILESAVTTIQDCEDSVATVDADDKVQVYRNWLGLIRGDLEAEIPPSSQGKMSRIRRLNKDRTYISAKNRQEFSLPARSLLLIRNVGHHMYTDMIQSASTDEPVPEGFVDLFITALVSLYDLRGLNPGYTNSKRQSIYIVKPKQHGPEEVELTDQLFSRAEMALGLPRYTIKLGIMDEERRTTFNLKACIKAAHRRVMFVNTGFLDRTGDEIRSGFEAGAFDFKENLKTAKWIAAYESQNVEVALECGLLGQGQIGKGMWAEPDSMSAMVAKKIGHVMAGASTAWVPSPTAATLHATHYHAVRVRDLQRGLIADSKRPSVGSGQESKYINDLLRVPIMEMDEPPTKKAIQNELENNLQAILGYVVRWIDQGVGCSKVPNVHGVGLMEDRATLRISSQHVANWLHHKVVSEAQVYDTLRRMASIVDEQNRDQQGYEEMAQSPVSSIAFQSAVELIFKGKEQPNGYTESILQGRRSQRKFQKKAAEMGGTEVGAASKL